MLDEKVFQNRLKKLVGFIQQQKADLAIVTPSPAFEYLTGIRYVMRERLIALLISPEGDPQIIAPSFEISELSEHTWVREFLPWAEDEDPYSLIAGSLPEDSSSPSVLFEAQLPLGVYWAIKKAVKGFGAIGSMTDFINHMRLLKSEEELHFMREAGKVIDKAVTQAFDLAVLEMTELEMRQVVQSEIVKMGANPTFSAVQFGEKSAHPHADSGTQSLKRGDIVLLDCGCSINGYNTDMTRVGVVGSPSDDQEKIHSIVLKAGQTAIENITPGLSCGAADGIARKIIEEAGYGEYFTHRLGHGIGLEVHEPPYLVRGNSETLETGMTHSVEPGIYLEGQFGIRIEDLVCVKEGGAEILTYTPRELHQIDL
ncbi:MAG: M24 family metallopeptidase [Candidatus Hodarchaeota archaeon]